MGLEFNWVLKLLTSIKVVAWSDVYPRVTSVLSADISLIKNIGLLKEELSSFFKKL